MQEMIRHMKEVKTTRVCDKYVEQHRTEMSFVLTMPGEIQLTTTPRSAHSQANVCVIFTTADLDALYAICFCGCGTSSDAMLAVLMILPDPVTTDHTYGHSGMRG